jgi:hypothetical protein
MKTYHEMIQFVVDKAEERIFQYHEWVAAITLAEVYGVPQEIVFSDIKFEIAFRDKAQQEKRKARHREENEARRLANLAAKEDGQ